MKPVVGASAVSQISIAILGDNRLFCEGLRRIILSDPSFVVVGDGAGAAVRTLVQDGVRDGVQDGSPQILLGDAGTDGSLAMCAELRRKGARPWVILVAAEGDDDWAVSALEAGARGILTKCAGPEDLTQAIRAVHEGQIWAPKQVIVKIAEKLATLSRGAHAEQARLAERLTRREQEIARHATSGLRNQEIAERLAISQSTVKAHLTRIFQKLGVRDRAQLTALYHRTLHPAAPR